MRRLIAVACCLALSSPVLAAPCDTPAHREFDFWIGEWQVHNAEGKPVGTNSIRAVHGGCALHESYTTDRGYSGESLNIYDASRKSWHQTWVDSAGTLLLLEGGMRDGRMVLEGRAAGPETQEVRHRITWTPNSDGTIRQLWESTDAEGQWRTLFNGVYTRKE